MTEDGPSPSLDPLLPTDLRYAPPHTPYRIVDRTQYDRDEALHVVAQGNPPALMAWLHERGLRFWGRFAYMNDLDLYVLPYGHPEFTDGEINSKAVNAFGRRRILTYCVVMAALGFVEILYLEEFTSDASSSSRA